MELTEIRATGPHDQGSKEAETFVIPGLRWRASEEAATNA
jgi:hypothetical protein